MFVAKINGIKCMHLRNHNRQFEDIYKQYTMIETIVSLKFIELDDVDSVQKLYWS